MHSALYYPFTGPKQESFLKTALFLWDSVDFIVPKPGFRSNGKSVEEQEALEIIGRNYLPTVEDQESTHNELAKLCNGPLAERLAFELSYPDAVYGFYPQKLLPETWEMLADSKLARIVSGRNGVQSASTGPLLGHYMMTTLAVCCAGDRKRLVTDQSDPHKALAALMEDDAPPAPDREDWHGRLIALTLSGPDFRSVPLKRMIELRKQENSLLTELRRHFAQEVDSAAADIAANSANPNVVRDRVSQFTSLMEEDLGEIKRALGQSAQLLSMQCGVSILAAIFTEKIGAVSGLIKGLYDSRDRRRRILREHPSSWLLETAGPRFPVV